MEELTEALLVLRYVLASNCKILPQFVNNIILIFLKLSQSFPKVLPVLPTQIPIRIIQHLPNIGPKLIQRHQLHFSNTINNIPNLSIYPLLIQYILYLISTIPILYLITVHILIIVVVGLLFWFFGSVDVFFCEEERNVELLAELVHDLEVGFGLFIVYAHVVGGLKMGEEFEGVEFLYWCGVCGLCGFY